MKLRFILFLALTAACSRPENRQVLARIGNRQISADALVLRAEFSPERFLSGADLTKEDLLQALIDEKLLAMEAEKRNMPPASSLQPLIEFAEDLAIMRELFHAQIADRIRLDSAQTVQTVEWSRQERKISAVAFADAADAERFRSLWRQGSLAASLRQFGGIEPDSLPYQRIVKWGEWEGILETTVFSFKAGEISSVVEDNGHCYVLRVDDILHTVVPGELSEAQRRAAVERILRAREESRLSRSYIAEFMNGREVRFNEPLVRRIIGALLTALFEEAPGISGPKEIPISESARQRAGEYFKALAGETLVRFRGGNLSIDEFLRRWDAYRFPIDRSSRPAAARSLNDQFSLVIRDYLLIREGRRRGLHKAAAVRDDVARWRDHYLAEALAAECGEENVAALIETLHRRCPVRVDSTLLSSIELTTIPFLALRPGQYASRVTPPWPSFLYKEP